VNYEWSTGLHDQQIRVFDKNLYWIKALNLNGCYSRDTIEVRNVFDPPVPYLGADIQLCELENKMLDAGNYSTYLWNDNSVARYLNIKDGGKYWVSVADKNNCKGSDTINVVKKDCTEAVYFPNSFTPNTDFKNDVFKALTIAKVPQKFGLYVFNRYGQIVFHSTDITKGWDGTYNGKLQPASGYVWRCEYQFEGKMLNIETGTVLLIR
jgi:gliding motility-associated-like protein